MYLLCVLKHNLMFNLAVNNFLQFKQKIVAERLFKGKKKLYPHSIRDMFVNSRHATHHETMYNLFNSTIKPQNETTQVLCLL